MNKKQQKKIDTIVDDLNFKIKVANYNNKNKNGSYIYYTFCYVEIFDVQHIVNIYPGSYVINDSPL